MRGSIRQRSKGTWEIQVYTGTDPNGKPRRHFETVRGTKGVAQQRLTELFSSLDKGVYTPPGHLTVAELFTQWLEGYVKTNCSSRTYDSYNSIIECHLISSFGAIRLKQLQSQVIQVYYGQALEKLSARTVAKHHRLLSQVLKYAVRQGYIGRNPCDFVDAPSWKGKPMRTLTPMEVAIFFGAAVDNQYYPVYYTAVSTGLRESELLGLTWRNVDLDYLSLSVIQILYKRRGVCEFKEPKTAHSRRRVAMTPKLSQFLRVYRAEQEEIFRKMGRELILDDLVFSTPDGKPLDPSVVSHNFSRIVKKAGLERVRFHDLRHTFASLMFLRGVPAKIISEALGHSSVAFTMDIYSHIIEGMQSDAMILLDDVLPSAQCDCTDMNNGKLTAKFNIKLLK